MRLEDQVCSLELAKKLKELGVRQESAFYWIGEREHYCGNEKAVLKEPWLDDCHDDCFPNQTIASAFTVAELGEMLPGFIKNEYTEINSGYISSQKHDEDIKKKWSCRWVMGRIEWADTEADARALMLIYLLEKGIINASQILLLIFNVAP